MTEISNMVQELRINWAKGDEERDRGLTTPGDIIRFDDISYGGFGRDNLLDIYIPKDTEGLLPVIFNIHGGGWVYGCKEVYQFYCMKLAQHGFGVVNINYRLAPENRFPCAVEDINAAMTFVSEHGEEYHLDRNRVIMVGDSAGGQLVSHYAAVLTDPDFAALFDFDVPDVKVRALGLNCGTYDGKVMAQTGSDEVFNEYIDIISKAPSEKLLAQVDTMSHITPDFPPSFVMSTYCDFLLPAAEPMYNALRSKGIPAGLKIYGSQDRPEIGHVFHVNCRLPEADICNREEIEFFKRFI